MRRFTVRQITLPTLFLLTFTLLSSGEATAVPVQEAVVQTAPQLPAYVLAPDPLFAIGRADGPDETLFSDIAGAVRLADGGVVVAVRGFNEIRRYGSGGEHLWTRGRAGEGPGEFRYVELLTGCTSISSIVAYGASNGTITVFDGEGSLVSSERFQQHPWGYGVTCAPGGRLRLHGLRRYGVGTADIPLVPGSRLR